MKVEQLFGMHTTYKEDTIKKALKTLYCQNDHLPLNTGKEK